MKYVGATGAQFRTRKQQNQRYVKNKIAIRCLLNQPRTFLFFAPPKPPKILKCESWISENLLKNGSILCEQSLNISEKSVKIKLPECQKKHLFFHQIFRHYLRYVSCLWGEKCNLEVQTYRHYLRYVSVLNAISADTHKHFV